MDLMIYKKPSKKKHGYKNKQNPTIKFEDLPNDISIDIISRLPIVSLVKFRSVSKFCHRLSQDPNLVSLYFSRSITNNPIMLFLSHPFTPNIYMVEILGNRNKETVRKIRTPIPGAQIMDSCNGILCLSDRSSNLHLYNPFTNRCEELITSYCDQRERFLAFGYSPLAKEYVVIKGLLKHRPWDTTSYIRLCSIERYSRIHIVEAPYPLEFSSSSSRAFLHGRFHWFSGVCKLDENRPFRLAWGRKILSFDLSDEQFRVISLPDLEYLGRECKRHLVVLRGLLAAVFIDGWAIFDIWIMNEYASGKSWEMFFRVKYDLPRPLTHLWGRRVESVVCISENGNLLVHYECGRLVSFNIVTSEATEIVLRKKPPQFGLFGHLASLNWIDTPISTNTS